MSNKHEEMGPWAQTIVRERYAHTIGGQKETWSDIAWRVARNVMAAVDAPAHMVGEVATIIRERKFIPGGRYLAASGRRLHQTQNCVLLRAEDSREGWSRHYYQSNMALMTGAGTGGEYSLVRPEFTPLKRTGGYASGPMPLIQGINEMGRAAKQGGSRRAAIWAALKWWHADVMKLVDSKNWDDDIKAKKAKDFNFPAPLDHTNISVGLDDGFFPAIADPSHPQHGKAHEVYWRTVRNMLETAEPGFSIDIGENAGEDLRNACTEVTSRDDSDICNLGSINMARIGSLEEMRHVVELATAFLLAGTVYSDVPYAKIAEVREKNRRLGLGLLGLHEWLLVRGKKYGSCDDLKPYLDIYATSTEVAAKWADQWSLSRPVKTRAIAPTGTIGIVAETTTGIEPIFCAAVKRRYYDHGVWRYQMVVDPTARRLMEMGIDADNIEDAYSLAEDVERRLAFQAWTQEWVDHAIASTINLPAWGSPNNNADTVQSFGETLLRYLPRLRGITCYPDGSRGGQPLTPVDIREALRFEGQVFTETAGDVCDLRGGSCGA